MADNELPFTDVSVKASSHKGRGNETEYRFRNLKGLVLHVLAGGKKTWKAHYSIQRDGRRQKRKVSLGCYPDMSLAKAWRRADDVLKKVSDLGDIVEIEKAKRAAAATDVLRFRDLVDEYLLERQELARIAEIKRELLKDAVPALGAKRSGEITAADVDGVARSMVARGAPAMASRMVQHLKALFNYVILDRPSLAERHGVTVNPVATLGRRRRGANGSYAKSKPRNRVLTDDEIKNWWRSLGDSDKRIGTKLALKIVLTTGQRPGEVRRSRKRDLHLTGSKPHWVIPVEHSKNGRAHMVPLSAVAVRLFKEACTVSSNASQILVFPSPDNFDEPIANVVLPSAQRDLFCNTLTAMTPATVHDLRRSAATGMRRLRIDRDTVAMVLNHTPKGITGEVYDHHDGVAEKRQALELWGKHVEALCRDS